MYEREDGYNNARFVLFSEKNSNVVTKEKLKTVLY